MMRVAGDIDPYAASSAGKLVDLDEPSISVLNSAGTVGDIVETRSEFREFVRAQIGSKWYRVSDYHPWRFRLRVRKVNESQLGQDINQDGDTGDILWMDKANASDATNWSNSIF
jgi:hypothetical protein